MDHADHLIKEIHHPKFFGVLALIWCLLAVYAFFQLQFALGSIFLVLCFICGLFFYHKHIQV